MLASSDKEFVKVMLDVQARKSALEQKMRLRKVWLFQAVICSVLVFLNSFPPDKATNNSGLFAFLAACGWMWFMRLDADIKQLKLAEQIREAEIANDASFDPA